MQTFRGIEHYLFSNTRIRTAKATRDRQSSAILTATLSYFGWILGTHATSST